jgi:hypothetical protein
MTGWGKGVRGSRRTLAVSLALLVAVGVASFAFATARQSAVVIQACYSKRSGALRIARSCHPGEKPLVWNRTGPAGPVGPGGATGPAGAAGPSGPTGPAGSARAYAYVNGSVSSPSFAAARTRGFSAVSEPAAGEYCLTAPGIDPATTAPAVTPVYASGFATVPTDAKLEAAAANCAAGQFEVLTQDIQSGAEVNSANLDFTIVVP